MVKIATPIENSDQRMHEGGFMDAEEVEQALKVVVVGDGGVGKSSLIRRYCTGVFTSQYKKTIGVDFLEKIITLGDRQVRAKMALLMIL